MSGPDSTLDGFGWSSGQYQAVLDALREVQNLNEAAERAGLSMSSLVRRRDHDETFRAAWAESRNAYVAALGEVAKSRALHGYTETRTTRRRPDPETTGELDDDGLELVEVQDMHKHDNALLMSVLARLDPATWGKKDGALDDLSGRPIKRLIVEMGEDETTDTQPEPEKA